MMLGQGCWDGHLGNCHSWHQKRARGCPWAAFPLLLLDVTGKQMPGQRHCPPGCDNMTFPGNSKEVSFPFHTKMVHDDVHHAGTATARRGLTTLVPARPPGGCCHSLPVLPVAGKPGNLSIPLSVPEPREWRWGGYTCISKYTYLLERKSLRAS